MCCFVVLGQDPARKHAVKRPPLKSNCQPSDAVLIAVSPTGDLSPLCCGFFFVSVCGFCYFGVFDFAVNFSFSLF